MEEGIESMKLHLGCGKRNFGPEWIHIDGGNFEHLSYKNITDLSQFNNESVDLIYASHVIEYFDREEVIPLLQEWKRVLKKGGVLRLAVPNFSIMCNLYIKGVYGNDRFLGSLYGKMKMNNNFIYHKTVYDEESLKEVLVSIGFSKTKLWNWRETDHSHIDDCSQAYLPHMDKENGIHMSLNMEAVK